MTTYDDRSQPTAIARTVRCLAVLAPLAMATACDEPGTDELEDAERAEPSSSVAEPLPASTEDLVAEEVPECVRDRSCVVRDVPVAVVGLPTGNSVQFFAHDDDSVGVLEAGPSAAVLVADPRYADLGPLELFWGLTEAGTEVPEGLIAQQEHLVAREDALVAEEIQAVERGWMLDEIDALVASSDPDEWVSCSNSWGADYCGQGGVYNSGWCSYGATSHATYGKSGTNRFRSFHCQQQGWHYGSLDYITQNSTCGNTGVWHEVWYTMFCEREDYLGTWCEDKWRAATWTWYPGSSSSRRRWWATTNYGAASSDTNYDWGNKARYMGCG